jgi:hypothetical protein
MGRRVREPRGNAWNLVARAVYPAALFDGTVFEGEGYEMKGRRRV